MNEPSPSRSQQQATETALREREEELAEARRERDALAEQYELSRANERLLQDELQHRVRNMLGVIRSILRRTLETSASRDEFADHLEGRLDAITRYQANGVRGHQRSVELEDIVRDELLPTRCLDTPSCIVEGPAVYLLEPAIEPVALAIHELATNAFKFGALSRGDAKLEVRWSVDDNPAGAALHFQWLESGVPVITPVPAPYGFGRQYIEEGLRYQLGAATSFTLRPGGVACTIDLPLTGVGLTAGQAKVSSSARATFDQHDPS